MKKYILVLVISFIYNYSFSQSYIRKTKNGGINGYNYTSHKIDSKSDTKIKSNGPGYEKCPTKSGKPAEQPAIDYAIKLISTGILKGQGTIEGVSIKWKSDNKEMSNSLIVIK